MDWKELEKKREEFTDVEWGIIEYIKRNIHHVISMNISELASVTYTSNASIIRTCRKLNCSGFKELKQKIGSGNRESKTYKTICRLYCSFLFI